MKNLFDEETVAGLDSVEWRDRLIQQIDDDCGFRSKSRPLAVLACQILRDEGPMTLRGLLYRIVSLGGLPNTDRKYYDKVGRVTGTLRECGVVPFHFIVDGIRATLRPSSWSGLADYAETTARVYRKDVWGNLPEYPHIFVEKHAMAGVLQPITYEYDVPLTVVRGYVGMSFAHEIAEEWSRIEKPIFAYYLGDYDPSGFDLELTLQDKLRRYSGRELSWKRLGVNDDDFDVFDLRRLEPKASDTRTRRFIESGRTVCAELDALPSHEVKKRVEQAILSHIPADEWNRLKEIERLEQQTWNTVIARLRRAA